MLKSTTTSKRSAGEIQKTLNRRLRVREQSAFGGNQRHRERHPGRIGEEHLVEPRHRAVEETEPVSTPLHLEEGLDLAVHQILVPEKTVGIERIEYQRGIVSEHLILDQQRHVMRTARQVQS